MVSDKALHAVVSLDDDFAIIGRRFVQPFQIRMAKVFDRAESLGLHADLSDGLSDPTGKHTGETLVVI